MHKVLVSLSYGVFICVGSIVLLLGWVICSKDMVHDIRL